MKAWDNPNDASSCEMVKIGAPALPTRSVGSTANAYEKHGRLGRCVVRFGNAQAGDKSRSRHAKGCSGLRHGQNKCTIAVMGLASIRSSLIRDEIMEIN
ncbi:hypothetical protein ALO41_200050 [Pseudomonas amygdali pv. ulmi]|uniref:Uncharacterized protein n=1 Tax=Pseudomonas amygdali pv. ulmi TaxID=251720 RepID=A0A0N8TCY7_PSEA0|nr:hypothetical protein ALO41_200050 [Pseudomonas amygdali pv. ulmi]RMR11004.1 hypothetical protein ALP90_200098 [Pseudomonas amygdali pv. ulmi]